MFSERLKQLRLARGLSLEELAAEMGGLVTKQALSKYEVGTAHPSAVVMNKIASVLNVKAAYLRSEPTVQVNFVAYRKRSALPKREQEKVQSLVKHTLEERLKIQFLSSQTTDLSLPILHWPARNFDDVENAATGLRSLWNLGVDSIASLTSVLEDNFIHVIEIDADKRFDGISAVASDLDGNQLGAAVVTRNGVAGERQRLNLAHELGHLVLKVSSKLDEEKAAFRFGAAFLAPADVVLREVGSRRTIIPTAELLLLKRKLGLSIQALLRRFFDLSIITESYYKQYCIDISRAGWRTNEPEALAPEKPQRMRQQVYRLLSEGLLTQEEAEGALGESVDSDMPLSLIERRAFMKLSLAERRKIMAMQAEKMASSYAQDTGRQEWQGGDFIEY